MPDSSTKNSISENNGKFHAVKSSLKRIIQLYIENAKLTAAEKLTILLSAAIIFVVSSILTAIAIAFIAVAMLELLQLILSPIASAIVMAGCFMILVLLIFMLRKPLIIDPTAKFMSKLIMDIGKDHLKE